MFSLGIMRTCLGSILECSASSQHQSGCQTNQITALMVPSQDHWSNRIRGEKAHKLWLY